MEIGGDLGASKCRCNNMRDNVETSTFLDQDCVQIMTQGGDGRITLDPATGHNKYHSAPGPSRVLAYASSTANDISEGAFARAKAVLAELGSAPSAEDYAEALEALRGRIRAAYGLA